MNRQDVVQLDRSDPLAGKRLEFDLPDDVIYLDGNSLGAMPVVANERSRQLMQQQWGREPQPLPLQKFLPGLYQDQFPEEHPLLLNLYNQGLPLINY